MAMEGTYHAILGATAINAYDEMVMVLVEIVMVRVVVMRTMRSYDDGDCDDDAGEDDADDDDDNDSGGGCGGGGSISPFHSSLLRLLQEWALPLRLSVSFCLLLRLPVCLSVSLARSLARAIAPTRSSAGVYHLQAPLQLICCVAKQLRSLQMLKCQVIQT